MAFPSGRSFWHSFGFVIYIADGRQTFASGFAVSFDAYVSFALHYHHLLGSCHPRRASIDRHLIIVCGTPLPCGCKDSLNFGIHLTDRSKSLAQPSRNHWSQLRFENRGIIFFVASPLETNIITFRGTFKKIFCSADILYADIVRQV